MVIVVRPTVGYRVVIGSLFLVVFLVLVLVPPFGSPRGWWLGLIVVAASCVGAYRNVGDRLRFSSEQVEYLNALGRVVSMWRLDGTTRVHVDDIVTQSRWGRALRGSVVISGAEGVALALPRGRYTKEQLWSRFLLDQARHGRLAISEDARTTLESMSAS